MGFDNRRNVLTTFFLKQATIVSDELTLHSETTSATIRISAANKALEELQNEAPEELIENVEDLSKAPEHFL